MMREQRGGRFAIRPRDADDLGIGVAHGKFNLGDDGRSLCTQFLDQLRLFWNAWAFDDKVGR